MLQIIKQLFVNKIKDDLKIKNIVSEAWLKL